MKRLLFVLILLFLLLLPVSASAQPDEGDASSRQPQPQEAVEIPYDRDAPPQGSYDPELYAQQRSQIGADTLPKLAPDAAKDFLERFGLAELDPETMLQLDLRQLLGYFWEQTLTRLRAPLLTLIEILGVVLLGALLDGMSNGTGAMTGVFRLVLAVFLGLLLFPPLADCVERACLLVQDVSRFMLAYIPVFAAAVLLSGRALSASAYHATLFAVMEGIGGLLSAVVTPLLTCLLAACAASSVSDLGLHRLTALLRKTVTWVLSVAATLLSAFLSLQTLIAQGADSVAAKTARFFLSSTVPMVGSLLSDALLTVKGCAGLLRTGVGAFGILTAAAAFLPLLGELAVWSLCLKTGAAVAEVFGQSAAPPLLEGAASVVSILIALLLCMLLLSILSTALLMLSGSTA